MDFSGTWDGSFTSLDNSCPFTVNPNPGNLFPMNVSVASNGVYTVLAANGDTATGGQGEGETISFTATSQQFGNVGSTAPYVCATAPNYVGYLEQGDNQAIVNVYTIFTNCTQPGNSNTISTCTALYSGNATKR